MLIDFGILCAWIAISAAGALVLVSLDHRGSLAADAMSADDLRSEPASEPGELAHEDVYPLDPGFSSGFDSSSYPLELLPALSACQAVGA